MDYATEKRREQVRAAGRRRELREAARLRENPIIDAANERPIPAGRMDDAPRAAVLLETRRILARMTDDEAERLLDGIAKR